ncbi:MAG: putative integral membrane protein [Candidatus Accumulibacter regalis]|jgi:uncharacterized membrane protein|uniref:Integral membrane protein n=1 Tax=Accumulibacter regalis TaxID=522306 RepID=A0A011QNB3_ACCRE|nr:MULTISPECIES: DUF2189 domain-containing protein [unclassified Candidatus Accumulibacter]EXI90490.1 MAG: putative integral membrane protein [Candidatus Accumulibacter regalis]MQM33874.1 DUF2189 domain-containing protein [Candidatus Accumulibacter phosphatis]MBL8368759.1 DUF2189 domain-containing protein [Accumulibacter sp.]MBN8515680.1 DUF2189 domain-containing protein [Accumulibacter sp.]MBO3702332.1 DUF2189 domain-containing protein [Accumulibacter sp.]
MPSPPAETSALQPQVLVVPLTAPVQWLILGWRDLLRCGCLSLAHGFFLAAFGLALMATAYQHFWLLAGAFSGFLVVAPVLATSLYAMSRAVEHGGTIGWQLLRDTWLSWQQSRFMESGGYWCLVRFGLLLALAGTGWVVTSAALITLLAPAPINAPLDFLRHVVLSRDNFLFETWLAMGGILAAPIFASSIVSMPLLLDRRSNLLMAVLTSWRVVLANPGPMALWAALIMTLVLISFATLMLGLIVLIPLLGHASWHAYRALVDASALPERPRAR